MSPPLGVTLTGFGLDGQTLERIALERVPIALDADALEAVASNRRALEAAIERGDAIYGVTTGLGALARERVTVTEPDGIQRAVLRSHAAGTGDPLPRAVVRAALALRLNGLLRARSGVRPIVLERVAALLNEDLLPLVPRVGSLGASGDLAPSAHAFLPLIGEGELAGADGETRPAAEALAERGLEPLELAPKEALALINGTHFMAGAGALLAERVERLLDTADAVASLSLDALHGALPAFDARVHELRPLPGQIRSAANVRALVADSERIGRRGDVVQDAYSLRCIPQVHGAAREGFMFFRRMVEADLNAVTDNPLVFEDPLEVVSAGNFHGQSLALAFDTLRLTLADLASISERRTFRILAPSLNGDLPPFLTRRPGWESGYMVVQYTAAALVAELRALAHPVSLDNVPTSDNQEDHVSMGMTAASLTLDACERAETVVAIEALCGAAALDLVPGSAGTGVVRVAALLRERVPALAEDRPPAPDIAAARELVASGRLAAIVAETRPRITA